MDVERTFQIYATQISNKLMSMNISNDKILNEPIDRVDLKIIINLHKLLLKYTSDENDEDNQIKAMFHEDYMNFYSLGIKHDSINLMLRFLSIFDDVTEHMGKCTNYVQNTKSSDQFSYLENLVLEYEMTKKENETLITMVDILKSKDDPLEKLGDLESQLRENFKKVNNKTETTLKELNEREVNLKILPERKENLEKYLRLRDDSYLYELYLNRLSSAILNKTINFLPKRSEFLTELTKYERLSSDFNYKLNESKQMVATKQNEISKLEEKSNRALQELKLLIQRIEEKPKKGKFSYKQYYFEKMNEFHKISLYNQDIVRDISKATCIPFTNYRLIGMQQDILFKLRSLKSSARSFIK